MRSINSDVFGQRIHKRARDGGFPLRVMFELTYRCNFKCGHCYVPFDYRKAGELNTKKVFSIIDQLADIGCLYLGFTGGEPFERTDMLDIVRYAVKKGFQVIIYSNGSLINDKIAQKLSQLRLNKIDITVPAMTEASLERITNESGSHKKIFKAIELLRRKSVPLGFKTCVLKENENEIGAIRNFALSVGALHRLDDMLFPCLDGCAEPFKYRAVALRSGNKSDSLDYSVNDSPQKRNNYISCVHKPSIGRRRVFENRLFKCGAGFKQAAITPLGELKICLMIDYPKYKILETSLVDCWNKLKNHVSGITPGNNYKCGECGFKDYCKWCPAMSWLQGKGSFTDCDLESRSRADFRKHRVENARDSIQNF